MKRLRNGSFLVECLSERVSKNLRKRSSTVFVDRPIKVSIHRTLNSTKGVIKCRELRSLSEAKICENLKDQGVTEIHRVTVRKGEEREPTNTLFVTFCVPKLPETLKIGYMRVKIRPYVPSPMRCFKCHRYGHTSRTCKEEFETCPRCGDRAHTDTCTKPLKCRKCDGSHAANDKQCPRWQMEREIQRVKTAESISFSEAKKKVEQAFPDHNRASYASVVEKPRLMLKTQGVQTSLTWVKEKQPVDISSVPSGVGNKNNVNNAGTQAGGPSGSHAQVNQRPSGSQAQAPLKPSGSQARAPQPSGPQVQAQASSQLDGGVVLSPETVRKITGRKSGEKEEKKKKIPASNRGQKGDKTIVLSNSFDPLEVEMSDKE